jgi:mannose-6-phosphate isomerase-like protein (cupin superfamily)
MNIVSKNNPLSHYYWGDQCDGWNFVNTPDLSLKLEKMPPHSAEQKHFHEKAQQFFFILKGYAVFEIEQERLLLKANQGIHIISGRRHRILNEADEDLEFLLSSQPSTLNDRMNC